MRGWFFCYSPENPATIFHMSYKKCQCILKYSKGILSLSLIKFRENCNICNIFSDSLCIHARTQTHTHTRTYNHCGTSGFSNVFRMIIRKIINRILS